LLFSLKRDRVLAYTLKKEKREQNG